MPRGRKLTDVRNSNVRYLVAAVLKLPNRIVQLFRR